MNVCTCEQQQQKIASAQFEMREKKKELLDDTGFSPIRDIH